MDIETLRTFLAAASSGSFSGAAKIVNASPSSVTERIKQLEYRLSAKLFDRDKRGCRLTSAGERFVELAQQSVRSWDVARQNISLPEEFTDYISFGGQYGLWKPYLNDWLSQVRKNFPQLAWRVSAGAGARLSRDLADGFLDLVVMYDPIFRRDMSVEKIYDDQLILVSANDSDKWRDHYVHIEWGSSINDVIASKLNLSATTGLILDLGAQSAQWLIKEKMCGYMPRQIIRNELQSGELKVVNDSIAFDYPAYICWRSGYKGRLISDLVESLAQIDKYN